RIEQSTNASDQDSSDKFLNPIPNSSIQLPDYPITRLPDSYTRSRFSGRALPIHHFRRELGGFAEVHEVGGYRVAGLKPFEIAELVLDEVQLHPPEEARRRLARRAVARVEVDQALQG